MFNFRLRHQSFDSNMSVGYLADAAGSFIFLQNLSERTEICEEKMEKMLMKLKDQKLIEVKKSKGE